MDIPIRNYILSRVVEVYDLFYFLSRGLFNSTFQIVRVNSQKLWFLFAMLDSICRAVLYAFLDTLNILIYTVTEKHFFWKYKM